MTRYAIDAPTLLQLVTREQPVGDGHQLVAPNFIRSEALQLLLDDVRRGERTERGALAVHEKVTAQKMRLLGDRVSRGTAWRIARVQGWDSLRDAEYLAIARLQADALVTVDPEFADRARGIVPLAPFEALLEAG